MLITLLELLPLFDIQNWKFKTHYVLIALLIFHKEWHLLQQPVHLLLS